MRSHGFAGLSREFDQRALPLGRCVLLAPLTAPVFTLHHASGRADRMAHMGPFPCSAPRFRDIAQCVRLPTMNTDMGFGASGRLCKGMSSTLRTSTGSCVTQAGPALECDYVVTPQTQLVAVSLPGRYRAPRAGQLASHFTVHRRAGALWRQPRHCCVEPAVLCRCCTYATPTPDSLPYARAHPPTRTTRAHMGTPLTYARQIKASPGLPAKQLSPLDPYATSSYTVQQQLPPCVKFWPSQRGSFFDSYPRMC